MSHGWHQGQHFQFFQVQIEERSLNFICHTFLTYYTLNVKHKILLSFKVQTRFKFKAPDKCKNSIVISRLLYFSHLPAFALFSEAEIGAAVLVIKAEETKQQISRLNNEVMSFCEHWTILTMSQGMLQKTWNMINV